MNVFENDELKVVDQINAILEKYLPRLKTRAHDVVPYKSYDDYLRFYTTKGHGLIVPLCRINREKIRIRSILKKTGALKTSWLINGQPYKGTKSLIFWGEHDGPEIILREAA